MQWASRWIVPAIIATLLRLLARTWKISIEDRAGLLDGEEQPPVVWVLWHNRLLIVPILYERFLKHRKGVALISQSKDGEILAKCIERFGGVPIRGSSSRGGSSALGKLRRHLQEGFDVYITPDGPRGPRYSFGPGALWLAQDSQARILPMNVEYSKVWRLGRWDGFMIPKPFATVTVTFQEPVTSKPTSDPAEFANAREALRQRLLSGTILD